MAPAFNAIIELPSMRYSGHESFACRYPWIPKAYRLLRDDPDGLANDENAIQELGVGKNMVRSIRFWIQVMGVVDERYNITPFGHAVFDTKNGFDPYLEDLRTLWLLHWNITHAHDPLFAWDFLFNHWHRPEIIPSELLPEFISEANSTGREYSPVTLKQHFDVFLRTYIPSRNSKGDFDEDSLDCPLIDLELIEQVAERRRTRSNKIEAVYAFRRERKPEINPSLFIYCLSDFWTSFRSNDKTLSFRDVSVSPGSLGQVFKLPEQDLRERLERIEADSNGRLRYEESASLAQVRRNQSLNQLELLSEVYVEERIYA